MATEAEGGVQYWYWRSSYGLGSHFLEEAENAPAPALSSPGRGRGESGRSAGRASRGGDNGPSAGRAEEPELWASFEEPADMGLSPDPLFSSHPHRKGPPRIFRKKLNLPLPPVNLCQTTMRRLRSPAPSSRAPATPTTPCWRFSTEC